MPGNLSERFEDIAAHHPSAPAVVADGERWTYRQLNQRADRLAAVLAAHGIGPGDTVGLLLANGNEHLEALLACFKRRAMAVNLNIRFVAAEVADVVADSGATLVVHEPDLADLVPAGVTKLARGAPYESALQSGREQARAADRSADDLYVLYTGATTGRPKGVLWRHGDLHPAALAGELDLGPKRVLVASPLSHGTGQWLALATLLAGGTVITTRNRGVDAEQLWDLVEQQLATHVVVVGDAFARPLVDALHAHPDRWSLDHLTVVLSGGATLSPDVAEQLLAALPWVMVVDGYGATETGGHARRICVAGAGAGDAATTFRVGPDTAVLDDDLCTIAPGDGTEGWLARSGPLPIGYAGDDTATAQTFPIVDGVRWAIPGDRARWVGPDRLEILGRGALTINTGGEKVHPEEVESVLRRHDDVVDAVVVGTADPRWGELVTAVVAPGRRVPTLDELADHCRAHLAAFKVPRRLVLVDAVRRSASGKPDYRWARGLSLR